MGHRVFARSRQWHQIECGLATIQIETQARHPGPIPLGCWPRRSPDASSRFWASAPVRRHRATTVIVPMLIPCRLAPEWRADWAPRPLPSAPQNPFAPKQWLASPGKKARYPAVQAKLEAFRMNLPRLYQQPLDGQSCVWASRQREQTDHRHNQDKTSFLPLTKPRRLVRQIHQCKIILTQGNIAKRLIVEYAQRATRYF